MVRVPCFWLLWKVIWKPCRPVMSFSSLRFYMIFMIFYDKYVIYENIICDIPQKLCKKIAGSTDQLRFPAGASRLGSRCYTCMPWWCHSLWSWRVPRSSKVLGKGDKVELPSVAMLVFEFWCPTWFVIFSSVRNFSQSEESSRGRDSFVTRVKLSPTTDTDNHRDHAETKP